MNITASGLVLNADSSLTITEPVGNLIMVPNYAQGTLTTEVSYVVVDDGEDGTHTIIEGEVISTGNKTIPSSDVRTVVRDGEGSLSLSKNSRHHWTSLILAFVICKIPLVKRQGGEWLCQETPE